MKQISWSGINRRDWADSPGWTVGETESEAGHPCRLLWDPYFLLVLGTQGSQGGGGGGDEDKMKVTCLQPLLWKTTACNLEASEVCSGETSLLVGWGRQF